MPGCYEGWEYPNQSPMNIPSTAPSSPQKIFSYILFQPIFLSDSAIDSITCFADFGIREFRKTEWALRRNAISEALITISEAVVNRNLSISPEDCRSLSSVAAASVAEAPWLPQQEPPLFADSKRAIHLKAVFWEGDVAMTPPNLVVKQDWQAWSRLKSANLPAESLHYFVISNEDNGYFRTWRQKLNHRFLLNGTPIDKVNPTAAGATQRQQVVASDTTALLEWLSTHK